MTETAQELVARLRAEKWAESITSPRDVTRLISELTAALARETSAAEREARLREALVVIAQAKGSTRAALNLHIIWNVTEIAHAALGEQP